MNNKTTGYILAALLILAMLVYFGFAFFGDSFTEDENVSSIESIYQTLATGGTLVVN